MNRARPKQNIFLHELLSRYVVFLLVFSIGVTMSFTLFIMARKWEKRQLQAEFYLLSNDRLHAIETGLIETKEILLSIGRFYAASREVERQEFHEFTKDVFFMNPDIRALEWLPRIPDSEREAFEKTIRQEGFPDFQITELNTQGNSLRAARRTEYFPVLYSEPWGKNKTRMGQDFFHHPDCRKAMEEARGKGEAVATPKLREMQELSELIDIMVYLPIYRNTMPHQTPQDRSRNLMGFTAAGLCLDGILERSLLTLSPADIDIYLYDKTAEAENELLYVRKSRFASPGAAASGKKDSIDRGGLQWSAEFALAGRTYLFQVHAAPAFYDGHRRYESWIFLFSALIITTVLSCYLATIKNRTDTVKQLVVEKTAELEKSKQLLENVTYGMTEHLLLLSKDFKILWANNAAIEKSGRKMEEIIGDYCYKVTHLRNEPCAPPYDTCPVSELQMTGKSITVEHTHFDDKSNKCIVEVKVYPVKDERGEAVQYVHVSRDITERKKIEAEREKLISDLREALSKVRTLSGLIPICASCKKIRDDQGYWHQVEVYVSEHTQADFSHSICEECARKLYPEMYKDKK